MLVHICCSVDSHFFLQKLQLLYPEESLVGYFYDPNIHPFSEYQLRLLDVKRSCEKLGIPLHEGEYNYKGWLEAVRGLEDEPEKGKRCSVCFDNRLLKTAKKAQEIGEKKITTTLLTSPKKSLEQLAFSLDKIAKAHNLEMLTPDFRKAGGTQEQFALAKRDQLYHQDYCGCIFALSKQREAQKRWHDELSTPLRPQTLPSSIEERLELYQTICERENENKAFKLKREKFLNYRLLSAKVVYQTEVIPSYFLFYSLCKKEQFKARIEYIHDDIGYINKEEMYLISLRKFNLLAHVQYKNVKELLYFPPPLEVEMAIRRALCQGSFLALSPIVVIDTIEEKREYTFFIQSKSYQDIREVLV